MKIKTIYTENIDNKSENDKSESLIVDLEVLSWPFANAHDTILSIEEQESSCMLINESAKHCFIAKI